MFKSVIRPPLDYAIFLCLSQLFVKSDNFYLFIYVVFSKYFGFFVCRFTYKLLVLFVQDASIK